MLEQQTKRIVLNSRPTGLPTKDNFRVEEVSLPSLRDGEVRLATEYISVDPYMRGRMNDRKSYVPPFALDDVIAGGVIAAVAETKSSDFSVGDKVLAGYGWQTAAVVDAKQLRPVRTGGAPVTTALGVLGITGLTAYFGLLHIGRPKRGETVVVSAAAGAVGIVVGQLATIHGARAIGIAGSDDKCRYLVERLGFDGAVNYKSAEFKETLANLCSKGVDVYFDNVGGAVSDAVMPLVNRGARIPICGQIALYNQDNPDLGPRWQGLLLTNSALMQGFTIGNYQQQFPEGMAALTAWVEAGQLKYEETIVEGFDNTIDAFLQLFRGTNIGKMLVKVERGSV